VTDDLHYLTILGNSVPQMISRSISVRQR